MACNGADRDPLLALALADPAREPVVFRPKPRLTPAAGSLRLQNGNGFPSLHLLLYAIYHNAAASVNGAFSQNLRQKKIVYLFFLSLLLFVCLYLL